MFWRDANGRHYGRFRDLEAAMARRGRRLEFGMNAGIFEPDGVPTGLHVEAGREWLPLNRRAGRGNFYLRPNGVFFVAGDRARILETEEYAAERPRPRLAVQSGPLLLRGGARHPAFRRDSASRLHRNGVGIGPNGEVIFAMTEFRPDNRVNLFDFAELFRALGCRDALFLDGDISTMTFPGAGIRAAGNFYGAMLGVTVPVSGKD